MIVRDEADKEIIARLDVIIELLRQDRARTLRRGPGPQETKGLDDGIQDDTAVHQDD